LGMSAITILHQEGCGCDVLGDPVWVSCGPVVGRCERCCVANVGDGTWEAILEDSGGIDGRYER
jgi:hypothetical protein